MKPMMAMPASGLRILAEEIEASVEPPLEDAPGWFPNSVCAS